MLQEVAEGAVDHAVFADLRVRHAGVAGDFAALETRVLAVARGLDSGADGFGGFTEFFVAQVGDGERGCFDVDVDAVEERAADARAVTLDLRGRAAAFVFGVAEVAAGAPVCCQSVRSRFGLLDRSQKGIPKLLKASESTFGGVGWTLRYSRRPWRLKSALRSRAS